MAKEIEDIHYDLITLFVNDTDIYNETLEEIKHIMILHGYILISLGYDTYLRMYILDL